MITPRSSALLKRPTLGVVLGSPFVAADYAQQISHGSPSSASVWMALTLHGSGSLPSGRADALGTLGRHSPPRRRRLVNDRYRDLVTRANKTGLVLAGLLGLLDVIGLFSINTPFPEGMTTPPDWLVILVAILGLVTLAAIVPAWRGNHGAVLVVVVTRTFPLSVRSLRTSSTCPPTSSSPPR